MTFLMGKRVKKAIRTRKKLHDIKLINKKYFN